MTTSRSKKIPATIREQCLARFQKLRRLEEANDEGYVTCISCGKRLPWNEAQGGHYVGRSCKATEIEHDNVWPQCPRCNGYLQGNLIMYRRNLVRRIGEARVKRIEDMAAAYKGDEDAMSSLCEKDQLEVNKKKGKTGYLELKRKFEHEIRLQRIKKCL